MKNDLNYLADHSLRLEDLFQTRRQFLNRFGLGLGALGLATMLGENCAPVIRSTSGASRPSSRRTCCGCVPR